MPNHLVMITMDSCRYDSCAAACTPNMDRIGEKQRRYSYGSFTVPSHAVLLMGVMPHTNPIHTFATEVYKNEFADWTHRLGVKGLTMKSFVPHLWLPKVLHDLRYRTIGRVSLNVLDKETGFNRYFDDYEKMDTLNEFAAMVSDVEFPDYQPFFYFFNLGETHYPYMLTGMPKISGVHGVFKRQVQGNEYEDDAETRGFFDPAQMRMLKYQQVRCVEYIDGLIGELIDKAPENTHIIITADHGELFGEEGYFGHGPIMHPKCFEVPFIEGMRPVG
jgi:Sulfatase